jgi:hypothetical protein
MLTSSHNQNIDIEIIGIRSIVASSVAVLSKICLENALWLWFLADGSHFAVVSRRCLLKADRVCELEIICLPTLIDSGWQVVNIGLSYNRYRFRSTVVGQNRTRTPPPCTNIWNMPTRPMAIRLGLLLCRHCAPRDLFWQCLRHGNNDSGRWRGRYAGSPRMRSSNPQSLPSTPGHEVSGPDLDQSIEVQRVASSVGTQSGST